MHAVCVTQTPPEWRKVTDRSYTSRSGRGKIRYSVHKLSDYSFVNAYIFA